MCTGERQTEGEGGRERERKRERKREREGRERIPSSLCAISAEPDMGFNLTNPEIMT